MSYMKQSTSNTVPRKENKVAGEKHLKSINETEEMRAHIECAFFSDDATLLLIGWLFDPKLRIQNWVELSKERSGELQAVQSFVPGQSGVVWNRSERPDVSRAMNADPTMLNHRHGFVMAVPKFGKDSRLGVKLTDNEIVSIPFKLLEGDTNIQSGVKGSMGHSGTAFFAVVNAVFGAEHHLSQMCGDLFQNEMERIRKTLSCDHAFLLDGHTLVLNAWVGEHPDSLAKIEVANGKSTYDLTESRLPYIRPDLFDAFPRLEGKPLGFIAVKSLPSFRGNNLKLVVTYKSGRKQAVECEIETASWKSLFSYVQQHQNLFFPVFAGLKAAVQANPQERVLAVQTERFYEMGFDRYVGTLPGMVDDSDRLIAAIDKVYTLGAEGMLVFGWKIEPRAKPCDILVCNESGDQFSVTENIIPLIREDLLQGFQSRVPDMRPRSGFAFYIPMPTNPGDARLLKFRFPMGDEIDLKLPTQRPVNRGVPLIKEILGMIPQPGRMNHELFSVFDNGLGAALEAINQTRSRYGGTPEVRQFGEAPANPKTSIIVPLYGRCDFMRHQLAQFADDPELKQQDLIYVVDDPRLLEQVHELAAKYQWLFDVPFRVVWYGQNLGFAGANNVGAQFAKGERLLLLNSDVFPKHPNWLAELNDALDTLPEAGAVGPLLQFSDDTVQHAGMYPRRDLLLPGFLLNTHLGMGVPYEGGDEPTEHPLLTAACVLVDTADFSKLGGFDEGYVIGDFEDSDLCLALRRMGKKLYLIPKARLWHLERQSQTLDNVAGVRQLITLFNGWRYQNKIKNGELANPFEPESATNQQSQSANLAKEVAK